MGSPDLVTESEDFVRALAAYGWITVPMVAPPADPLRGKARGARVGKLRFLGPAATYEGDRRPERAEAYLELAAAHRGGGHFEEAAEAYDRAYYYFWGDPRTKDRQAVALAGLGAMLEQLGEEEEARHALEMAAELDPSALPELTLPPTGRLHDPLKALRWTAAATSGHLVRSHSGLGELVDDLELRLRVTYQVAGEPTGGLEPVSVRWQPKGEEASEPVRAVQWSRLGAPARLDRALARVALERPESELGAGVAFGGREVLEIEPLSFDDGELKVVLGMGWPAAGPRPRGLRLTLVSSAPTRMDPQGVKGSGLPEVSSRLWPIAEGATGEGRSLRAPSLDPPVPFRLRGAAVAVVWRDLDSGLWGGIRHPTGLP
jgi:tetratricopeptide (TPR) repeat protein